VSAKMVKVKDHPGIYKRGSRYVVTYRDPQGKQRKKSARTLAEARKVKAANTADVARGEWRATSSETFAEYANRWINTYTGRTRKGILDETREDYAKRLEQDAIPYFGRMRLSAIEPQHVRDFIRTVSARGVKVNTVRLALAPVKALFATAVEDGVLRMNPAAGVRIIAQRESFDDEGQGDEDVRALAPDELTALLDWIPDAWQLFYRFLADTGVRIGEAVELRWRDLDLGAGTVRVERQFYKGKIRRPKSRFGRRTLRLTSNLARELWTLRKDTRAGDDDLVFTAQRGGRVDQSNLMSRVLKPAAVDAGIGEWVGHHTFRHTCATSLFRTGWNAVQVQRWLGHHKASFTLDTYVHLLDEDTPEPIAIAGQGGNKVATSPAESARDVSGLEVAEAAV
jgi:integrase